MIVERQFEISNVNKRPSTNILIQNCAIPAPGPALYDQTGSCVYSDLHKVGLFNAHFYSVNVDDNGNLPKLSRRAEANTKLDTVGGTENAGLEKSGLENVGPNRRGGKDGTGKHGTKAHGWKSQDWKNTGPNFQGWKRRDWKTREHHVHG